MPAIWYEIIKSYKVRKILGNVIKCYKIECTFVKSYKVSSLDLYENKNKFTVTKEVVGRNRDIRY